MDSGTQVTDGTITLKTCGGGGGTGCFADGQSVVLESGNQVPIESIRVGDKVLASSPSVAEPQFSPVTWIMAHKTPKQILSISLETTSGVQGMNAWVSPTFGPVFVEDHPKDPT